MAICPVCKKSRRKNPCENCGDTTSYFSEAELAKNGTGRNEPS